MNKVINVLRDFTHIPMGRFSRDYSKSGEAFRDDILIPALLNYEHVIIELDGVHLYTSNFLHEVFNGIILKYPIEPDNLLRRLTIVTEEFPITKLEIIGYIKGRYSD